MAIRVCVWFPLAEISTEQRVGPG